MKLKQRDHTMSWSVYTEMSIPLTHWLQLQQVTYVNYVTNQKQINHFHEAHRLLSPLKHQLHVFCLVTPVRPAGQDFSQQPIKAMTLKNTEKADKTKRYQCFHNSNYSQIFMEIKKLQDQQTRCIKLIHFLLPVPKRDSTTQTITKAPTISF